MRTIRVDQITPKGKSKVHIDPIQKVFDMLRAQDALPVGPRQVS